MNKTPRLTLGVLRSGSFLGNIENMSEYDHLKIEKKWQKEWDKKKAYKTESISKKKKLYVLDMFPYPSGTGLHVGHPKGYIGSDVYARMKRMQGFNVLHPMGYDAFGLPAEQYALEHHIHPRKAVIENVKTFENQLSIIGLSYDWSRKVNTTDPEFYRWTQWIFLKLYNSYYNKDTDKAEPIENLIKKFEGAGSEWKQKTEKEKQDVLMNYRLAYEGYSEVNWCPVLGTVLANDEIVDSPKGPVSERGGYPVVKKEMRQWFLRITSYADRLLSGLDTLDWSEHIKEIQKNWIGKSEGSEIEFEILNKEFGYSVGDVTVFTTRADTLSGATYVVLAPEHPMVSHLLKKEIKNRDEVYNYIESSKNKTLEDRTGSKEKTGVELKGIIASHPLDDTDLSVWIADYVLADYGTGAIMAVPAHDERDFDFAKKYNLPIKQVVMPSMMDKSNPPQEGLKEVFRNMILAIVYNPKNKKYLTLKWKKRPWVSFITGGVDDGENHAEAAKREVAEETGYSKIRLIRSLGMTEAFFCATHKNENRRSCAEHLLFELIDESKTGIDSNEKEQYEVQWLTIEELKKVHLQHAEGEILLHKIETGNDSFGGSGVLINSGKFNGLDSEKAKKEITKEVAGKIVTKYKMRDAVFARQRYWGEPIPLKHDKEGIIHALKDKELPLKLPEVKSYMPTGTGESPLAGVSSWAKKGLETNTMPGWAGSSWYFLRYMDPKNKKAFADKKNIQYWKDVDMYVGGAEHATGHLLYSRFWNKFLKDYGLVVTEEPFKSLRNQGVILGPDGRKMSKRWGNTINPNDIVKTYGADTMRVYEMFMGPFEGSLPWSTDNIIGSRRFLERVWRLTERLSAKAKTPRKLQGTLHKTIKKVGEDINGFAFNTAVSAMMIFLNEMEKEEFVNKKDFELFLKILSPFAPHITEEIWRNLGHKTLLVMEKWPKSDPKLAEEVEVKFVVQINGKVRSVVNLPFNLEQKDVVDRVKDLPDVEKWLLGKEIANTIFVKNKLINFVLN
ncbi:MAG: class I tRNA ligase family protein [Nitrospira sp.]